MEVASLRRAAAVARTLSARGEPVAVTTDGPAVLVATDPSEVVCGDGDAAWDALGRIDAAGFWIGWIAYDLGRTIERFAPASASPTARAGRAAARDREIPDVAFMRFESVTAFDHHGVHVRRGRSVVGLVGFEGGEHASTPTAIEVGRMTSSLSRREHAAALATVRELLRAGDCYQVNLTRRLHSPTVADPTVLFAALAHHSPAPHATLVRIGDVAIASASPERFLRRDGRRVETAPIKGTHADADALRASTKDAAEHVMIVDLARNDLSRIARPGGVRVRALSTIERHPGLHHLVSRVEAELRDGVHLDGLVRATFPPASVTGAPKPRVLQAIEALEPVRRGVYCGAIGWVDSDTRRADLAVAIRTFTITPAGTDLGVGGGIVIDSRADLEWRETELKAARLLTAAGAHEIDCESLPAVASMSSGVRR